MIKEMGIIDDFLSRKSIGIGSLDLKDGKANYQKLSVLLPGQMDELVSALVGKEVSGKSKRTSEARMCQEVGRYYPVVPHTFIINVTKDGDTSMTETSTTEITTTTTKRRAGTFGGAPQKKASTAKKAAAAKKAPAKKASTAKKAAAKKAPAKKKAGAKAAPQGGGSEKTPATPRKKTAAKKATAKKATTKKATTKKATTKKATAKKATAKKATAKKTEDGREIGSLGTPNGKVNWDAFEAIADNWYVLNPDFTVRQGSWAAKMTELVEARPGKRVKPKDLISLVHETLKTRERFARWRAYEFVNTRVGIPQ